jgi:hypothetical protein
MTWQNLQYYDIAPYLLNHKFCRNRLYSIWGNTGLRRNISIWRYDIQHNDTEPNDTQPKEPVCDTQHNDILHNDTQRNDCQIEWLVCDTQHN